MIKPLELQYMGQPEYAESEVLAGNIWSVYENVKEVIMFKKEFIEKMKNDEELQELRKKVLSFSEKMGDAAYIIGKDKSYEDYKERLKKW